jgi:uncharacterized membrane protein YebE (DUF533 family)
MEVFAFIVLGALGGLAYILVNTSSIEEALQYTYLKRIALGAIAGLAYYFLYANYNFPDGLMAMVSGYAATDFIPALARRLTGGSRP